MPFSFRRFTKHKKDAGLGMGPLLDVPGAEPFILIPAAIGTGRDKRCAGFPLNVVGTIPSCVCMKERRLLCCVHVVCGLVFFFSFCVVSTEPEENASQRGRVGCFAPILISSGGSASSSSFVSVGRSVAAQPAGMLEKMLSAYTTVAL